MMAVATRARAGRHVDAIELKALAALIVVAAGLALPHGKLAVITLAIGFAGITWAIREPLKFVLVAAASLAVSVQYLPIAGAALAGQGQKALLLLALCAAGVIYGIDGRRCRPVWVYAFFAGLIFAPVLGDAPPPMLAARSLVTLSLGWLAMSVKWPTERRRVVFTVLTWLPLSSVTIGALMMAAGLGSLWRNEYTGVLRLQGASIPAHFAFICVAGVAAAALSARMGHRSSRWLLLMNLSLLFLSGTRASSVAGCIVALAYLYGAVKAAEKKVKPFLVYAAGALAAVVLALLGPSLIQRSFGQEGAGQGQSLEMSGRASAWRFYYEVARADPAIGSGLGSITTLDDGTITNHGFVTRSFVVPHNEYLRAFAELGVFGLLALVAAGAGSLRSALRTTERRLRGILLALIVSVALLSLVDNTVSTPQMFVLFGLLVGFSRREATTVAS